MCVRHFTPTLHGVPQRTTGTEVDTSSRTRGPCEARADETVETTKGERHDSEEGPRVSKQTSTHDPAPNRSFETKERRVRMETGMKEKGKTDVKPKGLV